MSTPSAVSKALEVPTLGDVEHAAKRIRALVHHTPVLKSDSLDAIAGCELRFKCENFQKVGAFKMRGAANAALQLPEQQRAKGLCTHSSGNHGQAVARAAQQLQVPAFIVMPENSPKVKVEAVQGYGAKVVFCPPTQEDRESTLEQVQAETGATFIPPYDHPHVVAGQGTAALEFFAEVGPLDVLMAPIGGGGLISGSAIVAKALQPAITVYGAQPEQADDAYRSWHAGERQHIHGAKSIADGLLVNLGQLTWEIIRKQVDGIYTVSEEEIVEAMQLIWTRMKIICEPSCAVPFAALLKNKDHFAGKRVGIILTGGNVDLKRVGALFS